MYLGQNLVRKHWTHVRNFLSRSVTAATSSFPPKKLTMPLLHSEMPMSSSGSSGKIRGGPRKMISMRPPSAAIFFMTYFHSGRGGHSPLSPYWIKIFLICIAVFWETLARKFVCRRLPPSREGWRPTLYEMPIL